MQSGCSINNVTALSMPAFIQRCFLLPERYRGAPVTHSFDQTFVISSGPSTLSSMRTGTSLPLHSSFPRAKPDAWHTANARYLLNNDRPGARCRGRRTADQSLAGRRGGRARHRTEEPRRSRSGSGSTGCQRRPPEEERGWGSGQSAEGARTRSRRGGAGSLRPLSQAPVHDASGSCLAFGKG